MILWAYWPTLWTMGDKWFTDPQYSHGFLVPLFAAVLLWKRLPKLHEQPLEPSVRPAVWGMALVVAGLSLHLAGAYAYIDWLDAVSLLPILAGVCLCAGGRPALNWAWPSIAFLLFMVPLPYRVEAVLSHPLRRLATLSSTYVLQTIGLPAVAEGNVIILENARIGVVEACNGLGMLVTFFALTTGMAIWLKTDWWDKVVLLLSAIPVALVANVVRITVTGMLHEWVGKDIANLVFHDLAGLLMMPLALGLLWLEVRFLKRLFPEAEPEEVPKLFAVPGPRGKRPAVAPAAKPTQFA